MMNGGQRKVFTSHQPPVTVLSAAGPMTIPFTPHPTPCFNAVTIIPYECVTVKCLLMSRPVPALYSAIFYGGFHPKCAPEKQVTKGAGIRGLRDKQQHRT